MLQMKEHNKNLQEQINERSQAIYRKEFRVMMVKMIQDSWKRMEAQTEKIQEMFNKEIEKLRTNNTDEQ